MRKSIVRFFLVFSTLLAVGIAGIYYLKPNAGAVANGRIPWVRDYQRALRLASNGNKVIITDLYTDWCKWCKLMDEHTFSDPKVVAESGKYVYLKLNAEKDADGVELQRRFSVLAYPTILLLDQSGEEIDRINGYQTAEPFRKLLAEILQGNASLASMKRREAEDGSDLKNLFQLGRKFFSRQEFRQARVRFERVAEKDPPNTSGLTDAALFLRSICFANLGQIEESLKGLSELRSAFPKSEVLPEVDLVSAEIYLKTGRQSEAKKVYQAFLVRYPKHRRAEDVRRILEAI